MASGNRDDLLDLGLKALVAAAVVVLAIALVQALWLVLITPPPPPQGPLEQAGAARLPDAPSIPLADFHLFGGGPQPNAQMATPETTLDLVLKGTFAAADQRFGRALIADSNGEASYAPGMELPGGARLESIQSDHVMLRVDGRLESLPLRPGASIGGAAPSQPGPSGASMLPQASSSGLPGQPADFVNPVAAVSGAGWEAMRAQNVPDPAALARSITALPVLEGGRFVGVRLNAGANQALLAKAGLQPTDIITEINGIPIDSLARGAEIAQQLQSARSVRVSVRRDGRNIALPPINLDGSP